MKVLLLLILPFQLFSQDISGIWTGVLHTRGNDLLYELVINENKPTTNGYALTVFTINGVENIGVKSVTIKKKKGVFVIEDGDLIYDNYTTPPKRIKQFSFLSVLTRDTALSLEGKFNTRLLDFRATDDNIYSGTVELNKRKNDEDTRLVALLEKMKLTNSIAFIPKKPAKEKPVISLTVADNPVPTPRDIVNTIDSNQLKKDRSVAIQNPRDATLEKKIRQKPPVKEPVSVTTEAKNKQVVTRAPPVKEIKNPPTVKEKQADIVSTLPLKKTTLPAGDVKPKVDESLAVQKPVNSLATKAVIAERKTEIIQNMFFTSDSLILSLYDNGTVDGDTVTVLLNGNVILAKKGLTENAINFVLHITPGLGDSLQLTMYAENLGSIPPNTGLLIIQDGNARSEIRFEGDMQKSSAVILRRKR